MSFVEPDVPREESASAAVDAPLSLAFVIQQAESNSAPVAPTVECESARQMTNGERTWPGVVEDRRLKTGLNIHRSKGKKKRGTRGVPQAWGAWTIPKGQGWVGRRARMIWVQVYDALEARHGAPPNVSQLAVLSSVIDYQIYADLAKRMGCKRFNNDDFTPRDLGETFGKAAIATAARAKLILSLGIDANELDLFGAALNEDPSTDYRDAGIVINQPRDDEDRGAV